jgi:hypothetical protein
MTNADNSEQTRHRITWIVLGLVFIILAIIGVGVYHSAKASSTANAKADQLIAAIEAKGLHAPTKEQITRTLGDDGGSICDDPNSGLRRAVLNSMLVNGSGGPGTRPIIADSIAVQGQLLIIGIYCPDELAEFQQYVNDLKVSDVVKQ